jgi:hypothetical protein
MVVGKIFVLTSIEVALVEVVGMIIVLVSVEVVVVELHVFG